jgi:indolepyruvate ferredoxin oxidoreductase alpha subunit
MTESGWVSRRQRSEVATDLHQAEEAQPSGGQPREPVKELLLGDEAVALAAIHSGIAGAYAYPGTPSTEIFEYIEERAKEHNIQAYWTANEKVAYEQAVGMSYAGQRVIVSMKHVGLNVALDAFMSSALVGVHGALVVVVADDPGMASSQNEQDTRVLVRFALLPCFEPSNQQEAYDMTREAFEYSEAVKLPVVVRMVTHLAHSRAVVTPAPPRPQNPHLDKTRDRETFTLLPMNARKDYVRLTRQQADLLKRSEESPWNRVDTGNGGRIGVITCGTTWNYVAEAFCGAIPYPCLRIGMYPVPAEKVRQFIEGLDQVFVVEEGYPVVEELLRSVGQTSKTIHGRLDGTFPRTGELSPTNVGKGFGLPPPITMLPTLNPLPGRPPGFCVGCPHGDSFLTIKEAISDMPDATLFSDIGCYTLGYYPPYEAVDACLEMGASIGMAVGAAHAGMKPAIAIIGDSTFSHSGLPSLLSAVKEGVNVKVFILDNGSVAMTGNQTTIAEGDKLVRMVEGLGVDPARVHVLNPNMKKMDENVRLIREELAKPGVSVIISRRLCVQHKRRNLGE